MKMEKIMAFYHSRKARAAFGAALAVFALFIFWPEEPGIGDTPPQFMRIEGKPIEFADERQERHVDADLSFPRHEDILPGPPLNVVITFDTPLANTSAIAVVLNGTDYAEGGTIIDPNRLTMRRVVKSDAPDGVYAVNYDACVEGSKCRKGTFSFAVNRAKAQTYDDLRNKKEVAIAIDGLDFDTPRIRVSRGTKVVWKNNDDETHAIHTEPHPAHTYFEGINSKDLGAGESYNFTFWIPGIYPYHCSHHPKDMTGAIVVE